MQEAITTNPMFTTAQRSPHGLKVSVRGHTQSDIICTTLILYAHSTPVQQKNHLMHQLAKHCSLLWHTDMQY